LGANFTFTGQTNNRAGGGRWWDDNSQNSSGRNYVEKPQGPTASPIPKLAPEPAVKRPDPEPEDTSPDTAEAMYKLFHADEISLRAKQMAEEATANARYRQALENQRKSIDSVAGLRGAFNSPINQLGGIQSPINKLAGYQSPVNQLGGFQSPINDLYSGSTVPISRIGDTVEQHMQIAENSGKRQHSYAIGKRYRAGKNKNNGVLADARRIAMGDHMPGMGMFVVGPADYSQSFTFKGSHPMTGVFTAGKAGHPAGVGGEDPMKRSMNRLFWSSFPGGSGGYSP